MHTIDMTVQGLYMRDLAASSATLGGPAVISTAVTLQFTGARQSAVTITESKNRLKQEWLIC